MTKQLQRGQLNDSDNAAKLTCFAIGAAVGAVAALLFAPKSGRELREDIADATRKGVDRARETGSQIGERAGEYYGAARGRAGELASGARQAAARQGEHFTAAWDAGRQAYRDEKRRTESSALVGQSPAGEGGEQS